MHLNRFSPHTVRTNASAWKGWSIVLLAAPCAAVCLMASLFASVAVAQTDDVPIHDPVMIKQDDTYYLFGTGEGIAVWSSTDMVNWEREDPVFDAAPDWVMEMLPEFQNHIWAPDIYHHEGTYYLYYSVSAFGRNNSAIGVATTPTLHPEDPDFGWVDHGIVVRSVPGRNLWNAIDANVVHDAEGTPWMSFGSHWGGMKLVRLADNLTEVAQSRETREWHTIAARHRYWKLDERDAGDSANPNLDYDATYPGEIFELNRDSESGAIEAPFIFQKNGYYYLFVSWDRCCRGEESTYKFVVGRSTDITGPYVDRLGQKLMHGGGSPVVRGVDGHKRWAAFGHNSAYTFDGTDYLVFHAYDRTDEGRSKLIVREIKWGSDGWPTATLVE